MATSLTWRLKRYGRFVPSSRETGGKPWKVFEARGDKPVIVLTIVESGYLLILQGQESLDTIPLLCGSDSLKVHQKSDNLFFRFTVQGESRMVRMQFDGRGRTEAIDECSSAVAKLMEYVPVTTQDDVPLHPNQPPTEGPAPATQQTCQEKAVGVEPEVVQGSLSIKRLTQVIGIILLIFICVGLVVYVIRESCQQEVEMQDADVAELTVLRMSSLRTRTS